MEEDLAFSGRGTPETLKTIRVSANFLELLGAPPLLGTGFTAPDETALISFGLWQRRFGGNFHVIGQQINLGGTAYTVSGVLLPDFAFPTPGLDVWLSRPEGSPKFSSQSRALSPFLTVFGRLNPGVTLEQATSELNVIQSRYARAHPAMLDAKPKTPPSATPLQRALVSNVRVELLLLFGAVLLVLLIACANLASLLLARAAARSTEFAVRSALGASRFRIVKHLLFESLVLSVLGGMIGALLAFLSLSAIRHIAGTDLPRSGEIQFDGAVLAFALALSVVTAFLFGLAPSLSASRADLMAVLRSSSSNSGRFRLRAILVVGQIAFSMILLIGTTLLLGSILHLRAEVLGFDAHHLLTARVSLPSSANPARFFDDLLARVAYSPGVEHASASLTLPMTSYPGTPVQDAGQPILPLNQRPLAGLFIVTPDYFQTLRIPLRRGRTFTARDREGSKRVAVIDEGLARQFWPDYPAGKNPIGQEIFIGGVNKAPAEIVGIVADVHQDIENAGWHRSAYVPFAQLPTPSAMIAIRVTGDPMRSSMTLQRAVQSLDPALPLSDVQPMQDLVDAQLGARRILMQVLAFFASVAFVLSLVGVYGLVSYAVTQRTREMGVRRALGASQQSIVQMILTQTLRLTFIGVILGVAGAAAVTRFLKSYLFHISAADPVVFVGVAFLFLVVAGGAALIPAFRAANVEPMQALRYE
jgi:predicted permease